VTTILYRLWPALCYLLVHLFRPFPSPPYWFPMWPILFPSCSYIAGCFRLVAQSAATCSCWFLVRGFFYPEDGDDTFIRNVGSHNIYTAPQPRRRHSSNHIYIWRQIYFCIHNFPLCDGCIMIVYSLIRIVDLWPLGRNSWSVYWFELESGTV
jgi:hypothetical protein